MNKPVMKVVVPFTKNTSNQLQGIVTTLLPNTTYEFSVYAVNPFNYNRPSSYSSPVTTLPVTDTRQFSFEAHMCHGRTEKVTNRGKFKKCLVTIDYQERT